MSCHLVSKTFRPEHRDIEVVYLDAFGIEKRLYVGLASPAGPVNVEAVIESHFKQEDVICAAVKKAAG